MPLPQCQHCPGEVWEPECSPALQGFVSACKAPTAVGPGRVAHKLVTSMQEQGVKEGFRGGLGAALVGWDGYREMMGQGEVQGVDGYCLAKAFSSPC